MDLRLEERLRKWHSQIEKLESIEQEYLLLEAQEKSVEAELFLTTTGTVDERKSLVYDSEVYKDFKNKLALQKTLYKRAIRELDLKIKAYEAEYRTYTNEMEAILKHP